MKRLTGLRQALFALIFSLSVMFQGFQPAAAQQGGVRVSYNPHTSKVSFIGMPPGRPLSLPGVQMQGLAASDQAMSMVNTYAADFGLKAPAQELKLSKTEHLNGRQVTGYQQVYQGIPVMAGELVVDATDQGSLISMNGEISPALSLDNHPAVTAEQARQTALQLVARLYKGHASDYQATVPALWIYDSRLLQPDGLPAALVWRMDVTSKDPAVPLRELVLVDAQRGNVRLHFNQENSGWSNPQAQASGTSPTATGTGTAVPTATGSAANMAAPQSGVQTLTGTQRYVATTGTDAGACTATTSPCRTINYALGQASAGDVIDVASGTYADVLPIVNITKNISILGGWDASFSAQNGRTILDGRTHNEEIVFIYGSNLVVDISRVTTQNGGVGIVNNNTGGTLNLNRVALINSYHAFDGTGIYNWAGTINLTNSTISGDYAWGISGTAIHDESGTINIQYSTITNNDGPSNYAIYAQYSGTHIEIGNSILAGNSDGDCEVSGSSAMTSDGHNIFGSSPACYSFIGPAFVPAATDRVGVDPRLTPLLPGGFHALLPGSPAIDAASTTGCPSTDQRGATRPLGAACDIGAYEFGQSGSVPPLLLPYQGANQTIPPGTHAPLDLMTFVEDTNGEPVPGVAVTFAAPASGPGGTFSNGAHIITAMTNAKGIADPGTFTANALSGGYIVRATVSGLATSAPFPEESANPSITTYTMNHSQVDSSLPGTFVCNHTTPGCTRGANPDADHAEQFAFDTYLYYQTHFNRHSVDNAGLALVSSVQYGYGYQNAFWNGSQMVYGDGYSDSMDVVAHELTHGVTQHSSNLFEFYQSGAINESLSDIFGELIQHSYQGTADNWALGENLLPSGATRSMSDPTLYGDPDKMTSLYYDLDPTEADNGGIHHNNGIGNKAAYLMVVGGAFNGKTVAAIGADKTAAIYYEVDTHLLTSGADYADLYVDLYQACLNLVGGTVGITLTDCQSVQNAADAVEMNTQPVANYNTDAPLCPAGSAPLSPVFDDSFEALPPNWTFSSSDNRSHWQIDSPYFGANAYTGKHSLYADDSPGLAADASAIMNSAVTIPANAYLRFAQDYDFYNAGGDGGVVEYSVDNGAWTDAGPLMDFSPYNGSIASGAGNPLSGRAAFVDTSHGYTTTRLNLSSLAGQSVRFRLRMGLDNSGNYNLGWWVDDVRIYSCGPSAATVRFVSNAAQDGWVLESGETTNVGGTLNSTTTTFRLGDDGTRKQYRSILSFNTSSLADTAVITNVKLVLTRQSIVPAGTNPFNIFQGLLIDVRKGFFGTTASLQAADFQAAPSLAVPTAFNPTPVGAVYTIVLPSTVYPYINVLSTNSGLTQLRLRFKLDDNNDSIANYISFYSSNATTASYRPVLIITYHMP